MKGLAVTGISEHVWKKLGVCKGKMNIVQAATFLTMVVFDVFDS